MYLCSRNQKRDVAQLASAPRSGRGGRKFESSHPDYKNEDISNDISSFSIHTDKICIIRKTKNSSFKNEKSKKEVDVAITVSNKDIV